LERFVGGLPELTLATKLVIRTLDLFDRELRIVDQVGEALDQPVPNLLELRREVFAHDSGLPLLEHREWETSDGGKRQHVSIVAASIQFLGGRRETDDSAGESDPKETGS
jgi:hypothetical protein